MEIKKLLHGIFISDVNGMFLVKYVNDPKLKTELLSSFISGLFLFGKESVGHIDEISIKGLNMEIMVIYKHDLILSALFSKAMPQENMRNEAEQALDLFYETYQARLQNWDGDLNCFCDFEDKLKQQVDLYFDQLTPHDNARSPAGSESFFTKLLGLFKN